MRWLLARFWMIGFLLMASYYAYPRVRDLVLDVEITAPERGRDIALRAGCFTCHGADGAGGVKNPGNPDEEVPGFAGGTPMMWAKSEAELREYILDGAPRRKREDPKYKQTMSKSLLVMPAYRGYLSAAEVDDLIVYIRAVSGLVVPPDELAARGQEVAFKFGCFECHGPMGARGPRNPGSLKGYIPGWWGNDFRDLVRSDEELRAWILDGSVQRLRDNPIARHFIDSQRVYMPAYRGFIEDAELEALIAYLRWINQGDWQDKELDLGH